MKKITELEFKLVCLDVTGEDQNFTRYDIRTSNVDEEIIYNWLKSADKEGKFRFEDGSFGLIVAAFYHKKGSMDYVSSDECLPFDEIYKMGKPTHIKMTTTVSFEPIDRD